MFLTIEDCKDCKDCKVRNNNPNPNIDSDILLLVVPQYIIFLELEAWKILTYLASTYLVPTNLGLLEVKSATATGPLPFLFAPLSPNN